MTTRKSSAYNYLKDAILGNQYKPGQPLIESEIADELNMSRTPVREAIRELSREGLVETYPNRGAFVRIVTLQELLDIFDIKIRLEGLCAARASVHATPEVIERLNEAIVTMELAAQENDLKSYLKADDAYHNAIYEAAQNTRAQQIVEDLNAQWHQMRASMLIIEERMGVAVEEHRQIAEAIRAGDSDAADSAMRTHLTNLRNEIQRRIDVYT